MSLHIRSLPVFSINNRYYVQTKADISDYATKMLLPFDTSKTPVYLLTEENYKDLHMTAKLTQKDFKQNDDCDVFMNVITTATNRVWAKQKATCFHQYTKTVPNYEDLAFIYDLSFYSKNTRNSVKLIVDRFKDRDLSFLDDEVMFYTAQNYPYKEKHSVLMSDIIAETTQEWWNEVRIDFIAYLAGYGKRTVASLKDVYQRHGIIDDISEPCDIGINNGV